MATSDELKYTRSKYYVFREQVNTLATKILEGYNQYYSVPKTLQESYQIDGESGDRKANQDNCNKVKESYDLLINTTIPAINSKIDSLNSQIKIAEQKEDEEEKKKEEELAKQKAKAQLERI